MIDIKSEAIKIISELEEGYMPGLAYDTAWAAMVSENKTTKKPLFPKSLLWLITTQRGDGSWGADIEYFYDRLISTLASVIAMKKTYKSEKFQHIIEQGEDYIWYNIKQLQSEPQETVGFELLFPALMTEAEQLNLNLPYREKFFEPLKEKKMKLAIGELITSQNTTITFSLEFLGDYASNNLLVQAQNVNGSISNSPSATAFMLTKMPNDGAYNYLNKVLNYNGGSSMTLYPFDVFETAWVVDYFMKSGIKVQNHYLPLLDNLAKLWTNKGISMSKLYDFQDLDDTALVFNLLKNTNHKVNPKVFEYYEAETHFNCYPSERSPSSLVNIRVLKAFGDVKSNKRNEEIIEKIIKFLYNEREQQSYWIDKWNISPYYCTSLALEAIGNLDEALSNNALDWILKTQNYDGSWGQKMGTLEETAYALIALIHYHVNIEKIDDELIKNGLRYLEDNYQRQQFPELWIGKGLYCPKNVAKASVLAALNMGLNIN